MEINGMMMKSHAKTYGPHGMVRVKIALSREPERALIRRLYGPTACHKVPKRLRTRKDLEELPVGETVGDAQTASIGPHSGALQATADAEK